MSGKDTVEDILDGIYPKEAFEEIMDVETILIANIDQDLFYLVFNHIEIDQSDESSEQTVQTLLYLMFAYRYDLIIPMFSDVSGGQSGKINRDPSKNRPVFTKVSVSNAFRKKYGQEFDWVQNSGVLDVGKSAGDDGMSGIRDMLIHRETMLNMSKVLSRFPNLNLIQLEQLRKIYFEILAIDYKISLLNKVKKDSNERVTSFFWSDIFTDLFEDNEFMEFTGFKVISPTGFEVDITGVEQTSDIGIFQTSLMDLDKWADYLYRKELYSTHAYLIKKYAWVLQDDVFYQSSYLILGKSGDFYPIPKRKVDYGFDIKNPAIVSDSKILKYYEPIYYTSKQLDFDLKELFAVILAKGEDKRFDGITWSIEIEIAKLLLHHVIYLNVDVANFSFYLIEQLQNAKDKKTEFGSIVDGSYGGELDLQDMLKKINPYINLNLQIPKFVKSTKTMFFRTTGPPKKRFGMTQIPEVQPPFAFGEMPPPPTLVFPVKGSGSETESDIDEPDPIPKKKKKKRKKKKRTGTVGEIIDALTKEGRYQSALLGRQRSSSVWGTLRKWIRKAIAELNNWKPVSRNFRTRLDFELVDKTSSLDTYDLFFRGLVKVLEMLDDKDVTDKKIRKFIQKFMDAVDEHDKSEKRMRKLQRKNKEERAGLQTEFDKLQQKMKAKKQELDKLKVKQERKVEKRKTKLKRKREDTVEALLDLESLQPKRKKIKVGSRVVVRNVVSNNNNKKKQGSLLSFPCMNCGKPARMVCSKCQNVAYCGLKCFNTVAREDHMYLYHSILSREKNVSNNLGKVHPFGGSGGEDIEEEGEEEEGQFLQLTFRSLVNSFPKGFKNFMEKQQGTTGFKKRRETRDSLYYFMYMYINTGFLLKMFLSLQTKSQLLLTKSEKLFLPRMKIVLERFVTFNEDNVNHMIAMGFKEKDFISLLKMRKQGEINLLIAEHQMKIQIKKNSLKGIQNQIKQLRGTDLRSFDELRAETRDLLDRDDKLNNDIFELEQSGSPQDKQEKLPVLRGQLIETKEKADRFLNIIDLTNSASILQREIIELESKKIDMSCVSIYTSNSILVDKLIETSILNPKYKKLYKFLLDPKEMNPCGNKSITVGVRNILDINVISVLNENVANASFADSNSILQNLLKHSRQVGGQVDRTLSFHANHNKALLFSIIRGKNDRVKQVLSSSTVTPSDPIFIPLAFGFGFLSNCSF